MITNDLIIQTVEDHLIQTLVNINVKYPDIFTTENLKVWKSNINVFVSTIDEKTKINMKKKIKKQIISKKIKNTGIRIPKRIKNPIKDCERCQARIWANGKCSKSEDKIIYGDRCSNKVKENQKYCGIHLRNNPHGDFKDKLSIRNKLNYKSNSKCYKE